MKGLFSLRNIVFMCVIVALVLQLVGGLMNKSFLISWWLILIAAILHFYSIPRSDWTWKRFFSLVNIAWVSALLSGVFFALYSISKTDFLVIGCWIFMVAFLVLYFVAICIPWKKSR